MKMFERVLRTILHICLILIELYLFIQVQIGIYYLDEEQIIVNGFMLFATTCLYVSIFISSIMISVIWDKKRKNRDGRKEERKDRSV